MTDIEKKLNPWEINYENTIAVQGESQGRTINITIIDRRGQTDNSFNAESIDRPVDLTGTSVRLYCHKPDGTVTFSDGTITDAENGIASFILPYQTTTAAGDVQCEVLVTWPNNATLKAVGLHLDVQESNLEGAVESSSEYSALVTALNEIDQSVIDAQTAVTNANTAISNINTTNQSVATAESARVTAENGRVSAESTRAANETARKTAETGRVTAESSRVIAENQRQTNTQTAISNAETATANANTAADRANTAAQNAEDAIAGQLDPAIDSRIAAQKDVAGGIAGYDNAQAHYTNAALHVTLLNCAKSGTVYNLTGLTATSGKVLVLFYITSGTSNYASGDTVTIDGVHYAVGTRDGSSLTAGAWMQGRPITGVANIDNKQLIVDPSAPTGSVPISQKGVANGVATLDADGHIPTDQLNVSSPNYAGKLIVHVTSSDGGSITGTRVRIRNEQLGSNYVQPLDAMHNTTFSLLDNHTYYVVLLDYPSAYYGAAATVTITGGETQTLNLVLKTEPDIVGWRENVATGEIQYTDGAGNFQPMSVTDGVFDAGSWGESWLCDMRPCLLKAGIVQYYLKKTGVLTYDYTKQANDTDADITSGNDGDVMIEFPRVYYKFYAETDIQGVSWIGCKYSKTPQDDTWCCNAWLDKNGVPQEVMYMAAYDGYVYESKLRSLSGFAPTISTTIGAFRTAANANGNGYEQQEWTKRVYIQSLLPMLFKGLDSQALVGKGNTATSAALATGSMNDKPIFWGDQGGVNGVKFAGIENFWGNINKFADGLENVAATYKYKIYGPYNDTANGYADAGAIGAGSTQYTDTMQAANGYGMLPATTVSAEAGSKFHDYFYKATSGTYICYTGGNWGNGTSAGAWCLYLYNAASYSGSSVGASLSFTPQ